MTDFALPHLELFGLFEIEEAGTILYARTEQEESMEPVPDIRGQNFFELASLENRVELQEKIDRFIISSNQADSFYVTNRLAAGEQRVKVLLGRIRHNSRDDDTTSVLVHIRRV